jgi:general secretion pathway protein B
MSYILDALKKAEQKRRQGAFPDLLSVHEQTGFKAGKPARWPYILIGILLVSTGAVLPRLYERYSGAQNRERISVAPLPEGVLSAPVTPLRPTSAVHNDRTTRDIHDAIQQTSPAHVPAGRQPLEKSQKRSVNLVPAEREANTAPVNVPASAAVKSLPEMRPSSKRTTVTESELPPAIRQELPKVEILAHIYDSNPSSRIISIHGSAFHEGDNVAAGLRLESIIPEGVILSYKGYRFFKPLF